MAIDELHVVTGAFGYTGRSIAALLLAEGRRVATLTHARPVENPFGDRVRAMPFHFEDAGQMAESLRGAAVLYNTYWVRYNRPGRTLADAERNSLKLFAAARAAGVRRIVHVSVTNPAEDSPLEYFRRKARVERALRESGLPYSILRPAVLFGHEDILVNNMAWALRRLPMFAVFGTGHYKLQPIHVDDLAEMAVQQGSLREDRTIDAIGPEVFTYRGLVETIGRIIGKQRPILPLPPTIGYAASRFLGSLLRDVMVTREEMAGMMSNLLYVDAPPAGKRRLTEWATAHAATLGLRYRRELARRKTQAGPSGVWAAREPGL